MVKFKICSTQPMIERNVIASILFDEIKILADDNSFEFQSQVKLHPYFL